MLCLACSICRFYSQVNSREQRLAVAFITDYWTASLHSANLASGSLSFASVLLWTREVFALIVRAGRNAGDIVNVISGSRSYDTELSSCRFFDIRDFTQWRRECLTTAFATERNWDDNLVLSTVKLRYATMVFRTAFRTFGAKYKTQFSV